MKKLLILLLIISPINDLYSEDYQYQYFKNKKKYVPFSDYIPKVRLHYKTVPHYLEDYYELYGMKQYYNENYLRKNIERMKIALKLKFRHPSEALVKVENENEYLKYRNLMFMHLNILIMKNYLKIAAKYDKRKIYFFNLDFAKGISESLDIAKKLYKEALPFWNRAENYAKNASKIKITTDLGYIESERFSIINKNLDYKKIISSHLFKLKNKKQKLENYLANTNN